MWSAPLICFAHRFIDNPLSVHPHYMSGLSLSKLLSWSAFVSADRRSLQFLHPSEPKYGPEILKHSYCGSNSLLRETYSFLNCPCFLGGNTKNLEEHHFSVPRQQSALYLVNSSSVLQNSSMIFADLFFFYKISNIQRYANIW